MNEENHQSTQPDESSGAKMSGKNTLYIRGILTPFGVQEQNEENRKEAYFEVNHTEDTRVADAETGLVARLSKDDRALAIEWLKGVKGMIGQRWEV